MSEPSGARPPRIPWASPATSPLRLMSPARPAAGADGAPSTSPAARAALIADLRRRIADGTYTFPADVLARKLLARAARTATSARHLSARRLDLDEAPADLL